MKTWLLILQWPLLISLFGHSCKNESSPATVAQQVQPTVAQDTTQIISFEQEILPILKSRCSPCHFTGGKMYAKMPFDNPQTMKRHEDGVLKRFKDTELAKIKSYLESGAAR